MAASAAHQEIPEPLRYQTSSLKVSIHCEGCKKKVKRVLQSIEGVYNISIDSQLHKVIVTGNVDAGTLIQKLLKTGKQAELWPDQIADEGGAGVGHGKKSKSKSKNKKNGNEPSEINPDESNQSPSSDDSSDEASDKPIGQPLKTAPSQKPPEKYDGGQKVLIAVAPAPASAPAGGSRKKKKKKKKGRNNHPQHQQNNNPGGGGFPAGAVVQQDKAAAAVAVAGASGGDVQAMRPSFDYLAYNTQVPTYVVSYSSVQPSASYGGAHYVAPPFQQSSYIYSAATPGSYYIFSEENANACSVM